MGRCTQDAWVKASWGGAKGQCQTTDGADFSSHQTSQVLEKCFRKHINCSIVRPFVPVALSAAEKFAMSDVLWRTKDKEKYEKRTRRWPRLKQPAMKEMRWNSLSMSQQLPSLFWDTTQTIEWRSRMALGHARRPGTGFSLCEPLAVGANVHWINFTKPGQIGFQEEAITCDYLWKLTADARRECRVTSRILWS